jgi:transmembrane sensor
MTLAKDPTDPVVIRAQADAAVWMALLHSPERDPRIEAALKAWIASDPIHAATWKVATNLWIETGRAIAVGATTFIARHD